MRAGRDTFLKVVLRAEARPPGRRAALRAALGTVLAVAVAYPVAASLHGHGLVTGRPWAIALLVPLPGLVSGLPVQRLLGRGRIDDRPVLRLVVGVGSMAALLWTTGWPCAVPVSAALVGVVHVHRSGSRSWPPAVAVTVAYTVVGEVLAALGVVDAVLGTTDDLATTVWSLLIACLVIGDVGIAVARREHAEQTLSRAEAHLRALVESSPDVIDVLDDDDTVLFTSPAVRALGYEPADAIGTSIFDYVEPGHRQPVRDALATVREAGPGARVTVDALVLHADGTARWYEWRLHNLREDPMVRGVVLQQRDVHEHLERSALLEHAASHDPLTGLANRTTLLRVLGAEIPRCGPGSGLALLFIDLDGFKAINDTHGHVVGDRVLVAVAERLRVGTRRHDHLARLGGDEFCAVLTEVRHPDEVDAVVRRIHDELSRPVDVGREQVAVTASVGAVLTTDPRHEPDDLFTEADAAMYAVKRSRGRPAPRRTGPPRPRPPADPDRAVP